MWYSQLASLIRCSKQLLPYLLFLRAMTLPLPAPHVGFACSNAIRMLMQSCSQGHQHFSMCVNFLSTEFQGSKQRLSLNAFCCGCGHGCESAHSRHKPCRTGPMQKVQNK